VWVAGHRASNTAREWRLVSSGGTGVSRLDGWGHGRHLNATTSAVPVQLTDATQPHILGKFFTMS
jgi:hypothetical protein